MKIAFSGSHGTGKTTSVFEYCNKVKKKTSKEIGVLTEIARKSPLPINRETTTKSQMWIFTNQIRKEIELESLYDAVICDRTIVDSIAYTSFVDLNLSESMIEIAKNFVHTYTQIYFKLINDSYLIDDGIRDIDPVFQKEVEERMIHIYENRMGVGLIYV